MLLVKLASLQAFCQLEVTKFHSTAPSCIRRKTPTPPTPNNSRIPYFSPATYPAATLARSILATAAGISLFNLPSTSTASLNLPSTAACLSSSPIPSSAFLPDTPPSSATRSHAACSAASSSTMPDFDASAHRAAVVAGTRRFSCAMDRSRSSSSEISSSMRSRLRASKGSYS